MPILTLRRAAFAGAALFCAVAPAAATVTVFTNEAAFDAAVGATITSRPVADASFGSSTSYQLGPVTVSAPELVTYTGDYGAGVKSLGAFAITADNPVSYTTAGGALGIQLAYYVGPAAATYTIDGLTQTITVAGHPGSMFLGFVDSANPVHVDFSTNGAEFDTIRVVTAAAAGAVPEPATWAMLMTGFGACGAAMRRRRVVQPRLA